MTVVLTGFAVLLFMILVLRVPIAFAMGLVGFFGFAFLMGLDLNNFMDFRWRGALSMASNRVIDTVQNYGLSVIPLFVLMGNLVTRSGLAQELYHVSNAVNGNGGSLWWVLGDLWLQSGNLRDYGQGGHATDAQIRLCRLFGYRLYRCWRHSGHPDSAERDSDYLRSADRVLYP
jgi:hypothetical protein